MKTTHTMPTDPCPDCGARRINSRQWACGRGHLDLPSGERVQGASAFCRERAARKKLQNEVETLRGIADEQQATLKAWDEEIKQLRFQLIAAQESEAAWKTERDKADHRRLEAEAEAELLKLQRDRALESHLTITRKPT